MLGQVALAQELFRRVGGAEAVLEALQREAERRRCDWPRRARPSQLRPQGMLDGTKAYWLILAGRGFGKTRTGAETVRAWNAEGHKYVNLIGATADDARDIMIEGESGILACCPRAERPVYKKSERKLLWPNGAVSLVFTADEPERLRGKQHGKLWADELAAWRYPDSWDQAMFGLRLGASPQAVVTTTPKPTKIVKDLAADPQTVITTGTTYDNAANLAKTFLDKIVAKYEGTRLGRQELRAEILSDNPNALWQRAGIDETRVKRQNVPELRRIVVAVDPAVTSKVDSDETGIVVAGLGADGRYYVLGDHSLGQATPAIWAERAVTVYYLSHADRLVGEVNNGGEMVESTVRAVSTPEHDGRNVSYKAVRASRGKTRRAEPIAALYEQGKVSHAGTFPELEDQMCEWDPTIDDDKQASPDRMDALVWALTELSDRSSTGLLDHYAREAKAAREAESNDRLKAMMAGLNR